MYGGEPRLNVLKIPRRQHAGKTSVENLDLAYEKEQAKMMAKMKARSDVLAAYERGIGPSYSPITGTPIGTPRTRVGLQSDTVSEHGSAAVEVIEETPSTPLAVRHKRRDSGCINLFAPPPAFKVNTGYKVKPPFATDDETPRKYVAQRKQVPFATDADDDQPSTKPASTKPPVNFCWRWAFQDEDGNPLPLPEEEASAPSAVQTPDFSSMSPRGSPKYMADQFQEVDDEQ